MTQESCTRRVAGAVALLGCAVLLAAPSAAQTSATASIAATANVVGVTPLAATGVNDLDFGAVLAGVPSTPADVAAQGGRFNVTGEPDADVSVDFTLPTDLAGPSGTIPITFGATDGLLWGPFPTAFTTFDPNIPFLTTIDPSGNLTVGITGTVNPGIGTTSGTYTGTITLTVAYL